VTTDRPRTPRFVARSAGNQLQNVGLRPNGRNVLTAAARLRVSDLNKRRRLHFLVFALPVSRPRPTPTRS